MKFRTWWKQALVLLIAVFLLALGYIRIREGATVAAIAAVRGEIVQTVVSTGRVVSLARVEIGSVATGTVKSLGAREGERVRANQILVQLVDEESSAALNQANAVLSEAETRLRQLSTLSRPVAEESLKQAESNLVFAQAEYARTRKLFDDGFFSRAKLDDARRALDLAQAAAASTRAQAESTRPAGSELALAVARRDQARSAMAAARARLEFTRIRAPGSGVLLQRFVEAGDIVQPGKRLFLLAVDGETQLVVNVDEKNLGLIAAGQPAQAMADAFPGDRFSAETFYISPLVDIQRGTIEVKLRVPNPPVFLRSDMTVSVEIEAGRRKNVLIVPSPVIRDAASAEPWVLVIREGRAVRQRIKTGLKGAGHTEVSEGLAEGELLVPASETGVSEGNRVRPRESRS